MALAVVATNIVHGIVTPRTVPSISAIAADYDAFLLDQFGVLHDGKRALPGAVSCFEELAAAGKQLIVLSNTSRRRAFALAKLPSLGFDNEALTDFVCSGEQSTSREQAWQSDYLDGTGVDLASAAEADFVLCHGSMVLRDGSTAVPTDLLRTGKPSEALLEALATCAARQLPMVCANPDLTVTLPSGETGHMPGAVAALYEQLGGEVIYFGKPHEAAFEAALAALPPGVPRSRVLHVGDSLEHDVLGANRAGLHSLFVASGIHAADLGLAPHGGGAAPPPPDVFAGALERLLDEHSAEARPTHTVEAFRWA